MSPSANAASRGLAWSIRPLRPLLHPDLFEQAFRLVHFPQRFNDSLAGDVNGPRYIIGIDETVGQAFKVSVKQNADQLALGVDSGTARIASV